MIEKGFASSCSSAIMEASELFMKVSDKQKDKVLCLAEKDQLFAPPGLRLCFMLIPAEPQSLGLFITSPV